MPEFAVVFVEVITICTGYRQIGRFGFSFRTRYLESIPTKTNLTESLFTVCIGKTNKYKVKEEHKFTMYYHVLTPK